MGGRGAGKLPRIRGVDKIDLVGDARAQRARGQRHCARYSQNA